MTIRYVLYAAAALLGAVLAYRELRFVRNRPTTAELKKKHLALTDDRKRFPEEAA